MTDFKFTKIKSTKRIRISRQFNALLIQKKFGYLGYQTALYLGRVKRINAYVDVDTAAIALCEQSDGDLQVYPSGAFSSATLSKQLPLGIYRFIKQENDWFIFQHESEVEKGGE
jgi:hypothetical protein